MNKYNESCELGKCSSCHNKRPKKRSYYNLIPYLIAAGITLYAAIEQFYSPKYNKKENVELVKDSLDVKGRSIDSFFE